MPVTMLNKRRVPSSPPPAQDGGKEIDFPKGPQDTVSALRWSPVDHHLAASSWDGSVYIYDARNATKTDDIKPVTAIHIGCPVLDCDFGKDGTLAAAAAADNKVHLLDMASGQRIELASHSKPVRSVRFIEAPFASSPLVASGSWDKTIRCWDPRQPRPVATIELPERVWAMDASAKFLAAATANNELQLIDLGRRGAFRVSRAIEPPWEHQITSLSLARDGSRWAAGCIGGRAAVQACDDRTTSFAHLSFKCHREPDPIHNNNNSSSKNGARVNVYAVNDVAFCPAGSNLLATAGSDGTYSLWNVSARCRVRAYPKAEGPITAASFRSDGKAIACAVGYDWAQGYLGNRPGAVCKVMLRMLEDGLTT
ncbi:hypothetical protein VTJ83DRAFT_2558 [Remersonia thermophila]|uniref:Uncharacterized protein n=1 Tax=Remersonia thermophila TaxID=72144 RepID=A0ABR4DM26_9PEZI